MLSFILPVYKKGNILERCIKSLIAQSLKEWEAIFVLDGEDEIAEGIIQRCMKKSPNRYKVITIEHGGACKARNAGVNHAKGEYLIFWDADCIIEPHAAKAWIEIFERQPEVGFIYSGYRFLNENGAINSEIFDPWLLKINNYISSCFPLRRQLAQKWNEDLKSLQDWDFWLKVVEVGGLGKFMPGYAFATEMPDKESISGQGCADANWLERVDAVKKLHNISDKEICISSLSNKYDGIALAKYLDADYKDIPTFKPHRYKTIIQLGFSLHPNKVETHANIFSQVNVKKFIFWTPDDITEIYNRISLTAIQKYALLLNNISTQFVEDKTAKDLMARAGFKVHILPVPMHNQAEIKPFPTQPTFAVDIAPDYSDIFRILDKSLPDIRLIPVTGHHGINEYTGLVHFFPDKTLSNSIKRAILTGRHVISNVQDPHAGFIDETKGPEYFIRNFISAIRQAAKNPVQSGAREYYRQLLDKNQLLETLKCA